MAKKPSSQPGMHKEQIKALLRIKFGTLKAFAEVLGVDESLIRHTLTRPQPRTERLIAAALDTTPLALWPERYTEDVLLNPRHWRRHINVSSPKSSTGKAARLANCQFGS